MPGKNNLVDMFRKSLHPLLMKTMPERRDFPIKVLNPLPLMACNTIFVMNHSTKYDGPVACEVLKEHFYVLVGKQSLEILDRLFFRLNGVIYIDRKSRQSKKRDLIKC